jgi:hypothetical protein
MSNPNPVCSRYGKTLVSEVGLQTVSGTDMTAGHRKVRTSDKGHECQQQKPDGHNSQPRMDGCQLGTDEGRTEGWPGINEGCN